MKNLTNLVEIEEENQIKSINKKLSNLSEI